jgi:hypothetical protein
MQIECEIRLEIIADVDIDVNTILAMHHNEKIVSQLCPPFRS